MLHAVEGVEQGDAAGPALFAAGLVEPLSELRSALLRLVDDEQPELAGGNPATRAVAVLAYLDDTLIGVPPRHAQRAFELATEIFGRAGHVVHPGSDQDKTGCWSLATPRESLPDLCQRMWQADGLIVGGIPVYNMSQAPLLAQAKLENFFF